MTPEELAAKEARLLGQEISWRFMKRHLSDYDRSEESAKKIQEFLKEHSLEFSEENLERAFKELRAAGVSFTSTSGAASAEEELPPLPEVPGMNPQIFTMGDINDMDHERYKRLYFGSTSAQFRARVAEIIRREKEEK